MPRVAPYVAPRSAPSKPPYSYAPATLPMAAPVEVRVFLNYDRNTGVNGGFGEVVELVLPARPYPVV